MNATNLFSVLFKMFWVLILSFIMSLAAVFFIIGATGKEADITVLIQVISIALVLLISILIVEIIRRCVTTSKGFVALLLLAYSVFIVAFFIISNINVINIVASEVKVNNHELVIPYKTSKKGKAIAHITEKKVDSTVIPPKVREVRTEKEFLIKPKGEPFKYTLDENTEWIKVYITAKLSTSNEVKRLNPHYLNKEN